MSFGVCFMLFCSLNHLALKNFEDRLLVVGPVLKIKTGFQGFETE